MQRTRCFTRNRPWSGAPPVPVPSPVDRPPLQVINLRSSGPNFICRFTFIAFFASSWSFEQCDIVLRTPYHGRRLLSPTQQDSLLSSLPGTPPYPSLRPYSFKGVSWERFPERCGIVLSGLPTTISFKKRIKCPSTQRTPPWRWYQCMVCKTLIS